VYLTYQLQRCFRDPVNLWAAATQAVWSHPSLPATPLIRTLAAASEMLERSTRFYRKPSFGMTSTEIDGRTAEVQEATVQQTPFCNLIHFEREGSSRDPKVLLVAPLSGHHATLLRDTVRELLPDHDLYLTDWTDARLVPAADGPFDLDDYIGLIGDFVRLLGPETHVISVCQPAVAVLAAVALLAEDDEAAQPRTLSLLAGPIDTRINPTEVNLLAKNRPLDWFEQWIVQRVPQSEPGAGRRVCPGFVQLAGFVSMNTDRHVTAHWKLFRDLLVGDEESAQNNRRFYDEYLAVMDLPSEYYLQTVASVFQEHALAQGTMKHRGGRPVRPEAIRRTALLTVEGEKDDITGLGQTRAAHDLCSGIPAASKQHYQQAGAGHYGVFSGRRWREEIAPRIREFIRTHGGGPAK
jgi:poly(3-hydroxybutyrate) depolymerase